MATTQTKSQTKLMSTPGQFPPMGNGGDGGVAVIETEPMAISEAELNAALESIAVAPTLEPPAAQAAAAAAAAAVWINGKKVNALWSINQNRNSWAYFTDIGWRRFAGTFDSTVMAFTILTASAKQTQSLTNHREEADNQVHEIYVW